ncbi:MAG: hypothetical protein IKC49_00690 [Clostridia bacterium]|nr:hypothetical protein [Clostridia bacterium]
MINREQYDKEIDEISRLSFHNDLESILYLTIPINYKGKVTREDIKSKLKEWQTYDQIILNLKTKEYRSVKGLLSRLKIKKQLKEIQQPNLARENLRLMLGLMDLMDLDELIPEYIDEFIKYEADFYTQFKDIYEYMARIEYPFSKYIDTDEYCK